MRIGLFTESYDPVINGVSTSVKTLAVELASSGHRAVVVAPRFPGYEDEGDLIEVRRLASWRTLFNPNNPFAYPPVGPVPAALRGADLDIVHTQQPFGIGLHGRRIARETGVPLVSTFHTLYHEYIHYFPVVPPAVAHWWLSGVIRGYYAACDAVIVPSRAAGARLAAIGIARSKLIVVPTGVPAPPRVLPAAVSRARETFGLSDDTPLVLFVGRLAREKNLELLIDAFAQLSTPAVLLFAGSGPHRAACEERVRLRGIADRVRFAGFLSRGQLAPVYEAATVFAFPSPTETQGVVLSEAQGHGVPCVVVNAGGAPEFVRPGIDAEVVASEVDAFRAALEGLLRDEDRRGAYAAAARESPLRPTPEEMGRRIAAAYDLARARHAGSLRAEAAGDDAAPSDSGG